MEFTQDEKLAITSLVIDVIKVDTHLHTDEMGFLELFKKEIKIDIPTVEAAEDLDFDQALITFHKMNSKRGKPW